MLVKTKNNSARTLPLTQEFTPIQILAKRGTDSRFVLEANLKSLLLSRSTNTSPVRNCSNTIVYTRIMIGVMTIFSQNASLFVFASKFYQNTNNCIQVIAYYRVFLSSEAGSSYSPKFAPIYTQNPTPSWLNPKRNYKIHSIGRPISGSIPWVMGAI